MYDRLEAVKLLVIIGSTRPTRIDGAGQWFSSHVASGGL